MIGLYKDLKRIYDLASNIIMFNHPVIMDIRYRYYTTLSKVTFRGSYLIGREEWESHIAAIRGYTLKEFIISMLLKQENRKRLILVLSSESDKASKNSSIIKSGKGDNDNKLEPLTWGFLDDLFYQKYSEDWGSGELHLDYEWAIRIWEGKTNRYFRLIRQEGERKEKITHNAIWRMGRKVWEVGRMYNVREDKIVIGQIKLIRLENVGSGAYLIFEKAEQTNQELAIND